MNNNTFCVIMAGGIGTRFWPMSRKHTPKQFLDILGTGKSFIRATFERFLPLVPIENFMVVTNSAYKNLVLEHIPELDESQVLCEPIRRNTVVSLAHVRRRGRFNTIPPCADDADDVPFPGIRPAIAAVVRGSRDRRRVAFQPFRIVRRRRRLRFLRVGAADDVRERRRRQHRRAG